MSNSPLSTPRYPHLPTYLALLLLALLNLALALLEPFHRLISLDDPRLQYPFAEHERVPVTLCLLLACVLPLGVLSALSLLTPPRNGTPRKRILQHTLLGLALSLLASTFLIDLTKNFVGRPRPDIISRCNPLPDTPRDRLVSWEVCRQENHHVLHDGWRSFPSGHSGFAFSGLGYLALWTRGWGRREWGVLGTIMWATPLVGAGLIAVSRTMDYRHDVWDVCTGSTVGMVCAFKSYGVFFRGNGEVRKVDGEGSYERVTDVEMGEVRGR